MTQIKTGASRFGGRLFKSAATSALALSAVAGGVMVSGGEAKANDCGFGASLITPCTLGTWIDTNNGSGVLKPTDKQIWFFNTPTNASGDVEWSWQDINGNGTWAAPSDWHVDQWHVDVDFNPDFPAAPANFPSTSVFNYAIKITNDLVFHDVALATLLNAGGGPYTTVKEVFEASLGAGGAPVCSSNKIATLNNPPTPDGFDPIGGRVICVTDTLTVTAGAGSIDNYVNQYRQTPGPLPILGAGAAFGFSRKLRSRIKAARTA